MTKALVTGASGFIGSTLIEELEKVGIEPYALLRKTSDVSNLKGLHYVRVDGDLSNFESLKNAVRGMDYVFHLAGAVSAPDRDSYFRHNATGTKLLAEAVGEVNSGLKRFVHVSSLAAAGPAESLTPRVENDLNKPVSAYGESKLQGEAEILKFKDKFSLAIVRPPMVYGPKDKGVFVVIQTVAKRLMPLTQGATATGDKYYSSVHVRDLVRGIILVGLSEQEKVPSGDIFYLSSSQMHTYREMLETMAWSLGVKPIRIPVPGVAVKVAAYGFAVLGRVTKKSYPLNPDKLNEILPDYWICSNEKARKILGFVPEFELKAGMSDAICWYKNEKWL